MIFRSPDEGFTIASRVTILCITNFAFGFGLGYVYGRISSIQESWIGVTNKGISYRTKSLSAEEKQEVASTPSDESTNQESEPEEMAMKEIEDSALEVEQKPAEKDIESEFDPEIPTTTKIDSTSTETTDTCTAITSVSEEVSMDKFSPTSTETIDKSTVTTSAPEEVSVDKSNPTITETTDKSTAITSVSAEISVGKSSPQVRVTKLYVYPIKSCPPQAVNKVKLTPYGFENDLLFMIVDFTGRNVQLNRCPLLLNLKCAVQDDGKLLLELPNEEPVLHEPKLWGPHRSVMSDGKSYDAVDQGDDISRFLATGLELPGARLVRIRNENRSAGTGKRQTNLQPEQGFKNKYSCVLSSDVSYKEMKQRFGEETIAGDFHPNVMVGAVDILEPFAENEWKQVTANGCNFVVNDLSGHQVSNADKQMNESEIPEGMVAFGRYISIEGDVASDTFLQIGDILSVS